MASQTQNATSTPYNALDTSCSQLASGIREISMNNFVGIPSNACFSSFQLVGYIGVTSAGASPTAGYKIHISKDNGFTYCVGHLDSTISEGCDTSTSIFTVTCPHSNRPTTRTEAQSNSLKVKITWDSGDTLEINWIRHIWNWTVPPATPSAPTISEGIAQDVDFIVNRPAGTESPTTWDVQIATNTSFTTGLVTHTGIPYATTTNQFISPDITEGTVYYSRVRFTNSCGTGNYGTYDTWTALDTAPIPTGQALNSTTIRINQPATGINNPTHWQVWGSDVTTLGSFTNISGNIAIGTTIYDESGLIAGQTRYYKVAWYDTTGASQGQKSNGYDTETTQNIPTAPGNATYSARNENIITFDWTAAGDGGGTPPAAFVDYHYQWKIDGGSYAHIDTNSNTLSASKTGLAAGSKYWFQVHGVNVIGDGAWNTATAHWTLCSQPTISSAVGGASKITISWSTVTGVNTWNLERSPTGVWSGEETVVENGMSAGTLSKIDTVPKAGELWYYRLNAVNADSNLSTWSVNASATATAIQIFKPSSLRILATQQIFLPSSLTVILRQQTSLPSSLTVILQQQIFTPSTLKVRVLGQQISLPTSLVVSITQQVSISSTLRVLVFTASFTPEVTFSRYEFNDISSGTVDDDLDFGLWEGTKTLNAVRVDPYEATMVNPNKHEFYYTVNPRSGSENFFQNPVSNALINSSGVAENGYRAIGFDQQVWSSGTTELISLIDTDGDWAGSGARANLTGSWDNSGTGWSPPSASGTNVFDVPRPYNGTMVVVVQPTDWDGDTDHKLHDWLPFQVSVGHAVEVSGFSFISGTHEDSIINAQGNLNTAYDMSFRVYHEMAKEWEWYKGSNKIDSGTITPVKNTWKFINNVALSGVASSGTTIYSLYLFAGSGSVLHPNPVRVVTVNMII